ncbi:MAG: MerC domain-containing protein [Bacteroidota bacterium]
MVNLGQLSSKSDLIGATASTLCFIHCLATPFLFMAHASMASEHHVAHPLWWGTLDLIFLSISFLAVYWSARNTSKSWVRLALWFFWGLLALIVINEKLGLFPLFEAAIYVPTLSLIFLHFYNRRYCSCEDEACCTTTP